MEYAKNPISSRFLDTVLTQSAVSSKWKRKLMMVFMGRYKELVEDRTGSRVGDTIWDHADGFMKVRDPLHYWYWIGPNLRVWIEAYDHIGENRPFTRTSRYCPIQLYLRPLLRQKAQPTPAPAKTRRVERRDVGVETPFRSSERSSRAYPCQQPGNEGGRTGSG